MATDLTQVNAILEAIPAINTELRSQIAVLKDYMPLLADFNRLNEESACKVLEESLITTVNHNELSILQEAAELKLPLVRKLAEFLTRENNIVNLDTKVTYQAEEEIPKNYVNIELQLQKLLLELIARLYKLYAYYLIPNVNVLNFLTKKQDVQQIGLVDDRFLSIPSNLVDKCLNNNIVEQIKFEDKNRTISLAIAVNSQQAIIENEIVSSFEKNIAEGLTSIIPIATEDIYFNALKFIYTQFFQNGISLPEISVNFITKFPKFSQDIVNSLKKEMLTEINLLQSSREFSKSWQEFEDRLLQNKYGEIVSLNSLKIYDFTPRKVSEYESKLYNVLASGDITTHSWVKGKKESMQSHSLALSYAPELYEMLKLDLNFDDSIY